MDGSILVDGEVEFRGTTEPGAELVASPSAQQVLVDETGGWSLVLELAPGDNQVAFTATDDTGNATTVGVAVRFTPPMPCDIMTIEPDHQSAFPSDAARDWCGGWGYIRSVNLDTNELIFDLVQVEHPVNEDGGFNIINQNPLLRTLPFSETVEIRACSPEAGEKTPGVCGSPWVGTEDWQFKLWGVEDLHVFTSEGEELWRVMVDRFTTEVMWVEQWWIP